MTRGDGASVRSAAAKAKPLGSGDSWGWQGDGQLRLGAVSRLTQRVVFTARVNTFYAIEPVSEQQAPMTFLQSVCISTGRYR